MHAHDIKFYCRNIPIGIDPNAVWSKSDDDEVLWLLIFCFIAPYNIILKAIRSAVDISRTLNDAFTDIIKEFIHTSSTRSTVAQY